MNLTPQSCIELWNGDFIFRNRCNAFTCFGPIILTCSVALFTEREEFRIFCTKKSKSAIQQYSQSVEESRHKASTKLLAAFFADSSSHNVTNISKKVFTWKFYYVITLNYLGYCLNYRHSSLIIIIIISIHIKYFIL